MNIWDIPDWLEKEVRARDKKCVYCGIEMFQKMPRGSPEKQRQPGSTSSTTRASSPAKTSRFVAPL